jgi:hypothetical protein
MADRIVVLSRVKLVSSTGCSLSNGKKVYESSNAKWLLCSRSIEKESSASGDGCSMFDVLLVNKSDRAVFCFQNSRRRRMFSSFEWWYNS